MFRVRSQTHIRIPYHLTHSPFTQRAVEHGKIEPSIIGDICVGTVLPAGATYEARTAALAAGIPDSVPIQTLNRFCSSGLMAVTAISNQIRAGQIEVGLAIGIESMTAKYVFSHDIHRLSA
jgi:acetyl-CoA acyltransferase 1